MPLDMSDPVVLVRVLAVVLGQLAVVIVGASVLVGALRVGSQRIGRLSARPGFAERCESLRRALRSGLILIAFVLCLTVLAVNAWWVWEGQDPLTRAGQLLGSIQPELWWALARGLGLIALTAIAAFWASRLIKAACSAAALRLGAWGRIRADERAITTFFTGLAQAVVITLWMLVVVVAAQRLLLPEPAVAVLIRGVGIYVVVAVGLCMVRAVAAIVDTLDAFSHRYAETTSWLRYYDRLRPLVPLLRRCLEWALWVIVATLVAAQLGPLSGLAAWGPPLIKALGIFFAARVVIELGNLLIDSTMLRDEGDEQERRRRATLAPLFRTLFKQAALFIAFVLMLGAIGFDPLPFLAGAGILGVVIGLGAQPMINDVVSGFFILFENMFLVGDTIRHDGVLGTVESIDFRTTRLRDPDGNLHTVRNGDLRHVINYSKGYTHAVLELNVPDTCDLDAALAALARAGAAEANAVEVRGELEIRGVTAIDQDGVHLRAVMRVAPGQHFVVGCRLRLHALRELAAIGIRVAAPRRALESVIAAPGNQA